MTKHKHVEPVENDLEASYAHTIEADADLEGVERTVKVEPKTTKEKKITASSDDKKRIEDMLEDFISHGLTVEVEENFYTMSFKGITESGNLSVPRALVRRQADLLMKRFGVVV